MLALLALTLIVCAVVLLVFGAVAGIDRVRRRASLRSARWAVRHYTTPADTGAVGYTIVGVALMTTAGQVHDEHVVARIPDDAEDWQRDFLAARQEAEERAFHLNVDRPPLEG